MKSKEIKLGEAGQRRFYRILSFLIPFAVMLVCMTLADMYPFGTKGPALIGDANGEYYPHLILMRRILVNGESLLYSWRGGFGVSVVLDVLISFCTSPFNLLGFLLPESMYAHYLCFGMSFRLGLAGYFLAILFQQISKKADASVPVFCTAYALNMWMLTNFWQITMMDAVVITPLVLLGLLKLVRDRDMRLFPLMLGLSMLVNGYMTIFTAIICGFFWIGLLLMTDKTWRQVPGETLRFLGLSVLGAGMSLIVHLPFLAALGSTANFEDSGIYWDVFYSDFLTMAGQSVSGVTAHVNEQPANIAGSILLVLLIMGYLTASKIRVKERIYTFFVAAFIFFSLLYSPLNFIWHGFHYPYVTVQRFAYLFTMVLAFMGWRFTVNMHPEKLPEDASGGKKFGRVVLTLLQFVLMAACTAGACWCAYEKKLTDIIMLPLVAAGLLLLFYLFYRCFPKRSTFFHVGVICIVTAELAMSTWLTVSGMTNQLAGAKYVITPEESVAQAVDAVNQDANGQLFYRTGFFGSHNEELLYEGIYGGSGTFSSMIPFDLKKMCVKLGMDDNNITSKYYSLSTLPPMSSVLFDMQYVVSSDSTDKLMMYDPINGDADTANAYRFRYQIPLGFMIPENVTLDSLPDTGLTEIQNALAKQLTGEQAEMFVRADAPFEIDKDYYKDAEAKITDGSQIWMKSEGQKSENKDTDAEAEFENALHAQVGIKTTVPADGEYWMQLDNTQGMSQSTKRWIIYVNDKVTVTNSLDLTNPGLILHAAEQHYLGSLKKGDTVSMVYYLLPGGEGESNVSLSVYQPEVFDRVYQKLTAEPFTLTEFNQDNFTGTVTTENNALLYLSLPYRKGWTAYVDGAQTNTVPALDGMTGVYLMAGTHTVRLEYHTPMLFEGAVASGVCFLLYLLLVIIQQAKRRIARKRGFIDDEPLPDAPKQDPPKPAAPSAQSPAAQKPAQSSVPRIPAPAPAKPAAPEKTAAPAAPAKPAAPAAPAKPAAPAAPAKPAAPAAPAKPAAPAAPAKPASGSNAGERRRPGLYENHKPQHLKPEDEAEARFVKGAHFAGDDDDNADD